MTLATPITKNEPLRNVRPIRTHDQAKAWSRVTCHSMGELQCAQLGVPNAYTQLAL